MNNNFNRNFYTWVDQPYRDFMLTMLTYLEPRFEKKKTIIVDELDEVNELIFVYQGTVAIGYEINKQKRFSFRYIDRCVIGAFGLTFNQRASYIY